MKPHVCVVKRQTDVKLRLVCVMLKYHVAALFDLPGFY